jgi:hypothetical protein
MKLMVPESQTRHKHNQLNSVKPIKTGRLTAQWLVVNGQLIYKWIIA